MQALEERRQVQQFLDAAQALVGQQPESVEAIGRARTDAKRLVGQLPDIVSLRSVQVLVAVRIHN